MKELSSIILMCVLLIASCDGDNGRNDNIEIVSCGHMPNYIDKLVATAKWDLSRFPVLVFVDLDSLPGVSSNVMYELVNDAFIDWARVGGGFGTFQYTDTRSSADIIIEWSATLSGADISIPSGQAVWDRRSDGTVDIVTITLAEDSAIAWAQQDQFVYGQFGILTHELGHAWGMVGHPDGPLPQNSLMTNDMEYSVEYGQGPTVLDLNTVREINCLS